jgi:hypothetical protein
MRTERNVAPWTADEVASLNEYQDSTTTTQFSCNNHGLHGSAKVRLLATVVGWICLEPGCDYTQNWAHPSMADGTWRDLDTVDIKQFNDCLRKKQWLTQDRAIQVIEAVVREGKAKPGELHSYLCRYCNRWHTGRDRVDEQRWEDGDGGE